MKEDKYGLTPIQKRMIVALNNPDLADLNITEFCLKANVNRKTYYRLLKDPQFVEIKNKIAIECLKGKIDKVINAAYKFGTTNSKCSNDRKVLLNMAGLYSDKQEIDAKTDNIVTIKLGEDLKTWSK